ncbi:MAG: carbamoyltransferase HypF [Candidatus Edwardsbacteria bacterium RIFOXYD12_FULL_50_11]|uniref:Carbamoyltransferase n=1 Tax=Candidatus Edwardsbacteria bacterium GWF2_54_11 TaxID=1817851 RepID=A0A1F5R8L9_9BACT|nr:MAG: carbamoyltransferase HypF [Candidatus Edwardsbacteria bacterium RifOxyC12_full_54_24]OGF08344.1 MAG: carbamoyltransferase HypF [Candidatus Edwardsbacteria bacterium RifOxyA12_full_54_48]OGF10391.1 MAG: carbamoyltransferase HypF [Candidatus Edwardsbacteria bacterium GWF2_54_11]OGF11642.1 MAG: carbamoyltransferase HypF [Candidatus Edwardsbacteria bacterium GWE2_54_12]OGF17706.1 MAG: carbamoyltransferase HypF [Candidatus Edwardsbacteria bacterium RIFOXYD12_FULL_50_11]OGJ17113.1 MAG: carba
MRTVKVIINGIVQGVGFRPYIYRLAKRHRLSGWVLNSSRGVEILTQGQSSGVDAFLTDIPRELPPQASIDQISVTEAVPGDYSDFTIRESLGGGGNTRLSPDISLCDDCRREMLDPTDRRHEYPFINCTNCGPRFSIIKNTPYDRPFTTMSAFVMCPKCLKEYDDPENRRFHAQPNACPDCGPKVRLCGSDGSMIAEADGAVDKTARLLLAGEILAIKGIGGLHLACDAGSDSAVKKLRDGKNRPDKPLALMCGSLDDVRAICEVNNQEAKVLMSSQAPITLLRKSEMGNRKPGRLSDKVAPGNDYLGVMLPYAPVHHLLFKDLKKISPGFVALVMTSGNIQDEPVVIGNREALDQLAEIADHFLLNDREIENRNDDSIVFWTAAGDTQAGNFQIVRHSRGYAPNPINLPVPVPPTLAVGGEMKNVFCLASGDKAYVSQHIGEMDNAATLEFFEEMVDKYQRWFKIKPGIIVHDLHPDYLTTKWAKEQAGVSVRAIQHQKAHILSTLADNGKVIPAIGVAFDGTGYGQDGKIWGGEFFVFDGINIERAGHLEYLPLPGGEISIKKPYRIAAAYSKYLLNQIPVKLMPKDSPAELEVIAKQLENGFNLAWTSSLGRLFDAVSALLGVCRSITFEAQAAMALENCLASGIKERYGFDLAEINGMTLVSVKNLWKQLSDDILAGKNAGVCSAKFHNTIVDFTLLMCDNLRSKTGIKTVALSGGVFQNRFLLTAISQGLQRKGYDVLAHRQVPANDGGIALGQVLASFLK